MHVPMRSDAPFGLLGAHDLTSNAVLRPTGGRQRSNACSREMGITYDVFRKDMSVAVGAFVSTTLASIQRINSLNMCGRSKSQPVSRLVGRLASESPGQSVSQAVARSADRSLGHSIGRPAGRPIFRSTNGSVGLYWILSSQRTLEDAFSHSMHICRTPMIASHTLVGRLVDA